MKKLRRFAWLWLSHVACSSCRLLRIDRDGVSESATDLLTVTFIDVGQGDSILIETLRQDDVSGWR